MYNFTKRREKILTNNKIQKLITLIRSEQDSEKIDMLVADID